jgi:hypothetical protein
MNPFNIKIFEHNREVVLTVLPENASYKIIYYGEVIGTATKEGGKWDLSPYKENLNEDIPENKMLIKGISHNLVLDKSGFTQLAWEIDKAVYYAS